MPATAKPSVEGHDPDILAQARGVLNACESGRAMQEAVLAAVRRNARWRGEPCLNLLAPDAPTSPAVRALLAAAVGTRAAEGPIGAVHRWCAGPQHLEAIAALGVA
jgi:glycine hydroxymethyltransferase